MKLTTHRWNLFWFWLLGSGLVSGLPGHLAATEAETLTHIEGVTPVDAEGLIKLANEFESLIMIDARIAQDRQQGYIEGSISLPDIETNCTTLATIQPDVRQPLAFYCNGPKCGRSGKASQIAKACGYQQIYWFRDGFEAWRNQGFLFIKAP